MPKATANQFRLFLHPGAYWLMLSLRVAPALVPWRDAQFDTIRLGLIKVAARVTEMKSDDQGSSADIVARLRISCVVALDANPAPRHLSDGAKTAPNVEPVSVNPQHPLSKLWLAAGDGGAHPPARANRKGHAMAPPSAA